MSLLKCSNDCLNSSYAKRPFVRNGTCHILIHKLHLNLGLIPPVHFEGCQSAPCLNQGTCIDMANGYTCSCMTDFTGTRCEFGM